MKSTSIEGNRLFQGIPAPILADLCPEPEKYGPGDVIFREGDPAECLYLIESGTVRISKIGRGERQETLAYIEAGDFFGEMGLYRGQSTRAARATAVDDVSLGMLDRAAFESLLEVAPGVLVTNLLTVSVERLRDTDSRFIREMLENERLSLIGSMLSSIVHDIRGPLSVILGAADLLSMEGMTPDKREKYSGMVRRSVDRISNMVQEVLDYSKGMTRLNLEAIRPAELIDELNEEVMSHLTASGIEVRISVDYDEPVTLDRDRFYRVIQNIVKNAAEAMPDGGELEVGVQRRDDNLLEFRIVDTGVGIPDHILPTIFEPFVTHGKSGGTGLGMAIAKSVVEAHEGSIAVESEPGVGTRFWIRLPLNGIAQA